MALDRQDVEQLKEAEKAGLTTAEIIASAEGILTRNELKNSLKETGSQIFYRFSNVIDEKIEEIEKLATPEERQEFIVNEAFTRYKNELKEEKDIEDKEQQEEKDRLEELEKAQILAEKESSKIVEKEGEDTEEV